MPFPDSPQHPASAVSHSLKPLFEGLGVLHLQIDAHIRAFHAYMDVGPPGAINELPSSILDRGIPA